MVGGKIQTIENIRRQAKSNSQSDASFAQRQEFSETSEEENLQKENTFVGSYSGEISGRMFKDGNQQPENEKYTIWGSKRFK